MPSSSEPSLRTKHALAHLNKLKPYDGWSCDTYLSSSNETLTMLKRRNVPLSDKGYVELAVDSESKCTVGIVSHIGETSKIAYARGVVLVEKDGTVSRGNKKGDVIRVTLEKTLPSSSGGVGKAGGPSGEMKQQKKNEKSFLEEMKENLENAARSSTQARSTTTSASTARTTRSTGASMNQNNNNNSGTLTDEQNKELIQLVMMAIGAATALRIFSSLFFGAYVLFVPLVVLYALQTCPPNDTFDAKKELKRVLRGHHLPENHPDKPKNWFDETLARVQASVTTELATGLGHEVSFINLFGICTLVTVHVPVMSLNVYFVGIFGVWKYVLHMNTEQPRNS